MAVKMEVGADLERRAKFRPAPQASALPLLAGTSS
jgi:hypothetical protein